MMNTSPHEPDYSPTAAFYRRSLALMLASDVPFLVGGAFALERYTGLARETKDIDIFVTPADVKRTLSVFANAGYVTELPYPHWLAKVHCGEHFFDVIFSSGNGLATVDDEWFEAAPDADVMGLPVKLSPVEEIIWSKAFIMERERYDGADVAHLLRAAGSTLDWQRLLRRFDGHWQVLLSHLVLFDYIYPSERHQIPNWVVQQLTTRTLRLDRTKAGGLPVCRGTYLSRAQYLADITDWNYQDARVVPAGPMTPEQADIWTAAAIEDDRVTISVASESLNGDAPAA